MSRIDKAIVLGRLHLVKLVPGKFSINITLPVNFSVLRHASALHLICLIRVKLALIWKQRLVSVSKILIEVLLVVLRVGEIKVTW